MVQEKNSFGVCLDTKADAQCNHQDAGCWRVTVEGTERFKYYLYKFSIYFKFQSKQNKTKPKQVSTVGLCPRAE